MEKIISAKVGLQVKVMNMDAVIEKIFDNKYIYCKYLNPTKTSGDGCATTGGITTIDGTIVKHPNYLTT